MNVRLRNDFFLKSSVWYDDEFFVNNYTITCHFITSTLKESDHLVCLKRINYIFDELDNVCFIHQDNQKKSKALKNCKIKVIELPQEPVDQVIGLILFYKLNAICEDKIVCTELDISSELGQNIHYLHSINEESTAIPRTGWWADSTPNLSCQSRQTNEKIVKFAKVDTWAQYELDWEHSESSTASIHNINEN